MKAILSILLVLCAVSAPAFAETSDDRFMAPAERFNQGLRHLLGTQGESRSPETAFLIFEELADHDFAAAQHMLATLYHKGNGVEQDDAMAYYWYQRAANNGFETSNGKLIDLRKRMSEADFQRASREIYAQNDN